MKSCAKPPTIVFLPPKDVSIRLQVSDIASKLIPRSYIQRHKSRWSTAVNPVQGAATTSSDARCPTNGYCGGAKIPVSISVTGKGYTRKAILYVIPICEFAPYWIKCCQWQFLYLMRGYTGRKFHKCRSGWHIRSIIPNVNPPLIILVHCVEF